MSSFGSLFGTSDSKSVDQIVDALFKVSSGPVDKSKLIRERQVIDLPNFKRGSKKAANKQEEEEDDDQDDEEEDDEEEVEEQDEARSAKKSKKDASDDLEARYFNKILAEEKKEQDAKAETEEAQVEQESGSDSDSDSDSDSENEQEETASKPRKASEATKTDLKETELEKAERTVFVGNVISGVITSKPAYKKFKTLFGKYGKVQSIRFRSISFEDAVPRKVAFAKKSLHSSRDTVNAYVVYEAKEASLEASKRLNATIFEHNHLRTDHVAHPSPKDNRRTIFVGNLDFEEKEETLWKYFQENSSNDVELVRIIRDSKTNMGKGFALIQFKDTLSVNKALLLNDKPISKDKKRKLRIARASSKAKPSILSPNHIDNTKKAFASSKGKKLNDQQKTKLGRATTILGKADRATAGQTKHVLEGTRAVKGGLIAGIKGLKGAKVKKPRIRDRSTKFKEARSEAIKDAVQKERDPNRETRAPPRDSRGPPRDSRGPPRESRGPPRDSRGPPRESRGPPRDSRGPPRDSRGPPRESRGGFRGGRGGSRGGRGGSRGGRR